MSLVGQLHAQPTRCLICDPNGQGLLDGKYPIADVHREAHWNMGMPTRFANIYGMSDIS